uniref:Uncharacterized protein n=1 Tax=Anguilla anguilla TaxID=7936 RepID=A0A0E9VZD9_ANGAN
MVFDKCHSNLLRPEQISCQQVMNDHALLRQKCFSQNKEN